MVYKLILAFLVLTVVGEQSNPDEVIAWDDNLKLTWSNFQGSPKNLGDVVALTASGISFAFSIKETNKNIEGFTTQVDAHFYPKRSWFHKKKASDYILSHEQLHFDITELHVRKFRKHISELNVSKNIKRDLGKTYQDINKELSTMQDAYDLETDHSRDTLAQTKWRKKIEQQLKTYNDFKTLP